MSEEERKELEEQRLREEEEKRRIEEEERMREEEERRRYLSDKHCAYCTHLIPDKREGRNFYCDKIYSYVSGPQGACNDYEEAGRSTLVSDLIYSNQYGFEAEERDCAFCGHLIADKKQEGRYYCEVKGTYVKGTDSNKTMGCSEFTESSRNKLESELIRDDSEVLDAHSESFFGTKKCADCRFFDTSKEDGHGFFMCTKRNQEMPADQEECYMFESSGRSSIEAQKLVDDAKESKKASENSKVNDTASGTKVIVGLIIFAIIIVMKVIGII